MTTYIVFCTINSDGTGDFTHYKDIMEKLERYQGVQFVSVILFNKDGKHENFLKIQEELRHSNGIVYYGKSDTHTSTFLEDPTLIEHLKQASQAFYISYTGNLPRLYEAYLPANIPVKYIGEHDCVLHLHSDRFARADLLHLNRPLGLGNDYYNNPCLGIKLLDKPSVQSVQQHWETITEQDPAFSAQVLACTHSPDTESLLNQHTFMAAYFNRCWDFFEFLRIFTVNTLDSSSTSLVLHYSGSDLFEFMKEDIRHRNGITMVFPEKTPYLTKWFAQGNIKELLILSPNSEQTLRINGNDAGSISIKVLTGFYLSNTSLQSMYQLSKMVAVSGDNTLELAISMRTLPFYCSTNWNNKLRTLQALRTITQLPELALPEEVKQSFDVFFDRSSIETRDFCDLEYPRHDRRLQVSRYEGLNFPAMIACWPIVADYIRSHHNFYDRLDELVREHLPITAQPGKSVEQQFIEAPQRLFPLEAAQKMPLAEVSKHCDTVASKTPAKA